MFDFKAASAARPSGETTAALLATYGNPEGSGAGPSKQGGAWFEPSPAWKQDNLVKVNLSDLPGFPQYPGAKITGVSVHRIVAPILVATWVELHRRGLNTRLRTFNGSFAARHMGHDRTRPLSVHAFGAAIDFDAEWNGYGSPMGRMQIDRDVGREMVESLRRWDAFSVDRPTQGHTAGGMAGCTRQIRSPRAHAALPLLAEPRSRRQAAPGLDQHRGRRPGPGAAGSRQASTHRVRAA
ncbi:hypothetical protein [Deinococcus rubellus]|uniref:Peptidase M15A C-terminal domain-containing protein n=1 Tax=Deinococcus rubellus TaxID=1889240 RepID=A0ABY5YHZ9_9DEIO|nr:hypothetical protein [Deinococcus rubellus]UWX64739.1 hypothetical protein N0D28_03510 [Deinococcus rubellus]